MVCKKIGQTDPDIAGIGILLAFSAQGLVSLVLSIWVFYLLKIGRLNVHQEKGSEEYEIETGRLRIVEKVMMIGNDAQMATGIALIITALSEAKSIDLYHLHLIYDTVSFVGVSGAATMICWSITAARVSEYRSHRHRSTPRISRLSPRHLALYLYGILFFVLAVLLQVRLSDWNEAEEGHCYDWRLATSPAAHHPAADMVYIGFTAVWLLLSLVMAIFGGQTIVKKVLVLALLQFPLHLYMMVVLRVANSELLEGDHGENEWLFGQTVAMVLFGVTLRELAVGLKKYAVYNKTVMERRARAAVDLEARRLGEQDGGEE